MFKNKFILILILVTVLSPFISSLLNFYTDWLFFAETGFSSVFTTTLYAKVGVGLLFGALLFAVIMINLFYANRTHFPNDRNFYRRRAESRLKRDEAMRLVKPVAMSDQSGPGTVCRQLGRPAMGRSAALHQPGKCRHG